MERRLSALAAAALTACVAAATTLAGSSSAAAPAAGKADWTMMIYAVGDTSSVPEVMIQNLSQLTQLPDADNVHVVMLLDLPERNDPDAPRSTLPGVEAFSTAKLLELQGDTFVEVGDYGELPMGRPNILADFITVAAAKYPAEHYGLTLFDHGAGAPIGGYIDNGPPGQSYLSIPAMKAGIGNGLARSGIGKLDLLYHAACLLSSYETASALAPLADNLAGSEEIMIKYPIAASAFTLLAEDRSGAEVGKALIDGYGDFVRTDPDTSGAADLTAMSLVQSSSLQRLDTALESFAAVAAPRMPEIVNQVARARHNALEFVVGFDEESSDLIDLGDFLRNLQDVPDDVAVARDAVFAALQGAVEAQVNGRATEEATGLNVFLPSDRALVGDYLTDGSAPQGWARFVGAYLDSVENSDGGDGGGGDTTGDDDGSGTGAFGFTSDQAEIVQQDQTGILVAGQLTGPSSDVVASQTQVITSFGGQDQAVATVNPAYVDAGAQGQVQGSWSYDVTGISNEGEGGKVLPVTTSYQDRANGFIGSMDLQYVSPDGATHDVAYSVLLSSEGNVESTTVVDTSSGQAAGIELENGGTLTPYLYVPSSGGFNRVLSNQSLTVTDDTRVMFANFNPGKEFRIAVLVADAAGNVASTSTTATVQ